MTENEKIVLRSMAKHLWSVNTIEASKDMINILSNCLFKIFYEHSKTPYKNKFERDAKLVAQMLFTKLLSLNQMLDGIEFQSNHGIKLNKIVDPTVVAGLVRTFLETISMFNLIYICPKNDEEKIILYNLWVIAGLKYRQRFDIKNNQESKNKQVEEAATITKLIGEIEMTLTFKSLSEKGKKTIKDAIQKKDYKIKIINNEVVPLAWHEIIPLMGIREDLMGQMYTYFSLYAHPSNVAVFQFKDLFDTTNKGFISMTRFNVENVIKLVSCFIADYIKLFPEVIQIFNTLPLIEQIAINYHNSFLRIDRSEINNAISVLE
jgi:hypothetical protein